MLVFAVGGIYLIFTSFNYMFTVLTNLGGAGRSTLTWLMVVVVSLLTAGQCRR